MTRLPWFLRGVSMMTKQWGFSKCFRTWGKAFQGTSSRVPPPQVPQEPRAVPPGWRCLSFSLLVLILPNQQNNCSICSSAFCSDLMKQAAVNLWVFLSAGSLFWWGAGATAQEQPHPGFNPTCQVQLGAEFYTAPQTKPKWPGRFSDLLITITELWRAPGITWSCDKGGREKCCWSIDCGHTLFYLTAKALHRTI